MTVFDPITMTDHDVRRSSDGRSVEARWLHPELAFLEYEDHGDRLIPVTVLRVMHDKGDKGYRTSLSLEYKGPRYMQIRIERGSFFTLDFESAGRFSRKRLDEIFEAQRARLADHVGASSRAQALWQGRKFE